MQAGRGLKALVRRIRYNYAEDPDYHFMMLRHIDLCPDCLPLAVIPHIGMFLDSPDLHLCPSHRPATQQHTNTCIYDM